MRREVPLHEDGMENENCFVIGVEWVGDDACNGNETKDSAAAAVKQGNS